jgi:hypothetical protein
MEQGPAIRSIKGTRRFQPSLVKQRPQALASIFFVLSKVLAVGRAVDFDAAVPSAARGANESA